jgi:hypothetical protein
MQVMLRNLPNLKMTVKGVAVPVQSKASVDTIVTALFVSCHLVRLRVKREAGSGKREAGSGKREAGSGKREAGSGKREAGSGKGEGPWFSYGHYLP